MTMLAAMPIYLHMGYIRSQVSIYKTIDPFISCSFNEPKQRVPTIYVLEQNKKILYTPVNPSFTIQTGFKGVHISRTCFPDV